MHVLFQICVMSNFIITVVIVFYDIPKINALLKYFCSEQKN